MPNNAVNDVLGGRRGKSASFKNHGDFVSGEIIDFDRFQQRDFDSQEPLFWDEAKTQPRMQIVISLQTPDQDDEDDDGIRNVYIKEPSQSLAAFRTALSKARVKRIEIGGILNVRFVSTDEPKRKGASGQKQFAFGYRPPTRTLVPSEEGRYCEYHHTDLIQSPKSGKWGHVVDGQACFGLAAEPEDADDIPY